MTVLKIKQAFLRKLQNQDPANVCFITTERMVEAIALCDFYRITEFPKKARDLIRDLRDNHNGAKMSNALISSGAFIALNSIAKEYE